MLPGAREAFQQSIAIKQASTHPIVFIEVVVFNLLYPLKSGGLGTPADTHLG